MKTATIRSMTLLTWLALLLPACGATESTPPPPPPCDAQCQDDNAVRALREMIKLGFNLTLQGKPVGTYDLSADCPLGGRARLAGTATSNAEQGATFVDLVITFEACRYLQKDNEPEQNYDMTVTGVLTEKGTLAVQPTSTSAVSFKSDSITLVGTVYDPPSPYRAENCPLALGQDGSRVSGLLCGRTVGTNL
jgi:hypothetical protein